MDIGGRQFGTKRLKEVIRRNLARPLEELVEKIGEDVKAYYVGEVPADDLTVLAVRRRS
jgi:serine phosphatase RsbU (regulator of sigma subunit)